MARIVMHVLLFWCLLLSVGNRAAASRASTGLLAKDARTNVESYRSNDPDVRFGATATVNAPAQTTPHSVNALTNTEYDDDYDEDGSDDISLLLEAEAWDLGLPGPRSAASSAARSSGAALGSGDAAAAAAEPQSVGAGDGGDNADDDDDEYPAADPGFCHKHRYRKRTLKVVKEMPFVGLFPELQRIRRFEGSGITFARGSYWVVFDSLRSLGQLDLRFSFRGPENRLVGPVGEESQFEGIAYDAESDTFVVLRESMESDEHGLVPLTEELRVSDDGSTYTVVSRCPVRFPLQDVNKGFESLALFRRGGRRHMLGLCESNYCKTVDGPDAPGKQRGHGRLVWATYVEPDEEGGGADCSWEVQKVIKLPGDAYFRDYSAISFRGDFGTDVAVVSQEDAAVWVGQFDWQAMEFIRGEEGRPAGAVYHFPRDPECGKQYCNVEGVAWIDGSRLVFASDRAKKTQSYRCMVKDQSVHIMALP